jgi:twitching motility protein PilT
MDIEKLLSLAHQKGASDVHLLVGNPPMLRIMGRLLPVERAPLSPEDLDQAFLRTTTPEMRKIFEAERELDFAYSLHGVGRMRINACLEKGNLSLVMRILPTLIPDLDSLGLPEICKRLILNPRGFMIITGPTGSGKSTTLAAMIQYLNHQECRRVVTIEDPIEYLHPNDHCTISQRELGNDTHSFAAALKHVLRQDPDVILVGEMRDLETVSAAITAAETGHLVLSTGHAPSASQSVDRIIDLFPPHERHLAQGRLASVLNGIMCQSLIPRSDGKGRLPAVEVMLGTPAVKNLIREGKTFQLPNTIRTGAQYGMCLFDQSLVELYLRRLIPEKEVYAFCNDLQEVNRMIQTTGLVVK